VYVIPESARPVRNQEDTLGSMIQPVKDLPTLLHEMETQKLSQEKFEELIEALNIYSLKNDVHGEYEIRLKLHHLFYSVIRHKQEDKDLYAWLMGNQEPFVRNQSRLLELSFKERSTNETEQLIKEINNSSDKLKRIIDEFNCALPEQEEGKANATKKINDDAQGILTTVTETLSGYTQSALNWASQNLNRSFFTPKIGVKSNTTPKEPTVPASPTNL
jgi:hypothetical protein